MREPGLVLRVLLLRGINVGRANRVPMADLRAALGTAGLGPARTHLQSGNVLLDVDIDDQRLAARVREVVHDDFGVDAAVVVRAAKDLRGTVAADRLGDVADDPARRFVAFCGRAPDRDALDTLTAADWAPERVVADERELVLWCPGGAHESPLARRLARTDLGTDVTVRNWRTVARLAEMAAGE